MTDIGNNPSQVVYVLALEKEEFFADMTLVSLWSLRLHNPGVRVYLVCDERTACFLDQRHHRLLNAIDSLKVVAVPEMPAKFRHRFLRSVSRQHIEGPFLYLDSDTLVREDLSPLFSIKSEVAAAANHSGAGTFEDAPKRERSYFDQMGWSYPKFYANAGVIFLGVNPAVFKFSEIWHEKWKQLSSCIGKHYDQAAFNSAVTDSGVEFERLDSRYNAQIYPRPQVAWDAAIWHIYASMDNIYPYTIMYEGMRRLRRDSGLSSSDLVGLLKQQHPWYVRDFLDSLVISGLKKHSQIMDANNWRMAWLSGRRKEALKKLLAGNRCQ